MLLPLELEPYFQINKQENPAQVQPINSVGKELTSAQEALKNKLQSQEGYQSMGQVYKDPKTGKLILISNT